MTFPIEEQGREAQQQQTQEEQESESGGPASEPTGEPEPEEQETPEPATGEQKVEALLSVYGAICGMMAAQVENPAMAYRETLTNVVAGLPHSDMPMVCNLIDAGASSPEALVNAKAEVTRLIILSGVASAEHKAPGKTPSRRR